MSPQNRLNAQTKRKKKIVQNPWKAEVDEKKHPGSDGFRLLAKLLDTQKSNMEKKIQGTEHIKVLQQERSLSLCTKLKGNSFLLAYMTQNKTEEKLG